MLLILVPVNVLEDFIGMLGPVHVLLIVAMCCLQVAVFPLHNVHAFLHLYGYIVQPQAATSIATNTLPQLVSNQAFKTSAFAHILYSFGTQHHLPAI